MIKKAITKVKKKYKSYLYLINRVTINVTINKINPKI